MCCQELKGMEAKQPLLCTEIDSEDSQWLDSGELSYQFLTFKALWGITACFHSAYSVGAFRRICGISNTFFNVKGRALFMAETLLQLWISNHEPGFFPQQQLSSLWLLLLSSINLSERGGSSQDSWVTSGIFLLKAEGMIKLHTEERSFGEEHACLVQEVPGLNCVRTCWGKLSDVVALLFPQSLPVATARKTLNKPSWQSKHLELAVAQAQAEMTITGITLQILLGFAKRNQRKDCTKLQLSSK